jgi:hypothetical protein
MDATLVTVAYAHPLLERDSMPKTLRIMICANDAWRITGERKFNLKRLNLVSLPFCFVLDEGQTKTLMHGVPRQIAIGPFKNAGIAAAKSGRSAVPMDTALMVLLISLDLLTAHHLMLHMDHRTVHPVVLRTAHRMDLRTAHLMDLRTARLLDLLMVHLTTITRLDP